MTNPDPSAYLRELMTVEEGETHQIAEKIFGRYVETERDSELSERLKLLVRNASTRRNPSLPYSADNRRPGRLLLITAPSGSGKTSALFNALSNNPAFPGFDDPTAENSPIVYLRAPSPSSPAALGGRLLGLLGYDTQRQLKETAVWGRIATQLGITGKIFVVIDDLQHVFQATGPNELQKMRDILKDMLTSVEWPVNIILVGLPELIEFVRGDTQLRRRAKFVSLKPLASQDEKFMEAVVSDYANVAGLQLIVEPEHKLVPRLIHAGQRRMGTTIEILCEAIEVALDAGTGELTLDDFADAYGTRTLLADEHNPFVSHAWDALDTSRIDLSEEEDEATYKTKPKKDR